MSLDTAGYLQMAKGQTIPPLLLEVVLRSGRAYFVKNVVEHFDPSGLFALRVWDLRSVDARSLLSALNTRPTDEWREYRKFLPALDEGVLWLCVGDIEHVIEWHKRFWPDNVDAGRRVIGFQPSEDPVPRPD